MIEVLELCKSFEGKKVLHNINMKFEDAKRYCVCAPSGRGKTTFLHILAGLLKQDGGNVSGVDLEKIAFVFQQDRLCENLTVEANIYLVCSPSREELNKALEQVGLAGLEKEKIANLSGGMKRRVAIVRAALYRSSVIIMDEPFRGLDSESKAAVVNFLDMQCAGRTVIWVTHDAEDIKMYKSEIIEL